MRFFSTLPSSKATDSLGSFASVSAALLLSASVAQSLTLDVAGNSSAVQQLITETQFDYIVVGGGNAGLGVASRLASSNSSLNVLVLEAGGSAAGNPGVDVPGLAGSTFLSDIDWAFFTTPQEDAGGRSVYWPRGKVLGGSSALNFLISTRPNKAEHDVWAGLSGASGWSWSSILPFYKKAEHFFAPDGNTQNEPVAYTPTVHGTTGPIDTSYPPYLAAQFAGFFQSLRKLGVPIAQDLSSGSNHGVSYAPSSQHDEGTDRTRAYSVDYLPLAPNLKVLTSAQVTKVNFATKKNSNGDVVATGVTFVPTGQSGPTLVAIAKKEIVLSAGSVQTPQLLELSGIGNPTILKQFNIPTVVDLPGVGENLQDHAAIVEVFELKSGVESLDELSDPAFLSAALAEFATGQGILTEAIYPLAYLTLSDFTNWSDASTIANLGSQASNPQLPSNLWKADQSLYQANVPVLELLGINVYFGNSTGQPGVNYLSLAACAQHPLSRGNIHITSSNPLVPPAIDPNYLQSPLDLFIFKRAAQFLRKVAAQPALTKYIQQETEPGPSVQSDAQLEEWIRGVVRTEYHPIGTASMLPRSSNGVVSPSLKVYGTANLRVADVSVVPIHVSSHTQTVAYAVAEKAADLILRGK
ncbi:hypothetical protein JCM11641_001167 [Rhodosporidiobolus odoratus]